MKTIERAWYAAVRDEVRGALDRGVGGRWELPCDGLLDIERPLPFLIVAPLSSDEAIGRLSGGVASRFIVPADPDQAPGADAILEATIDALGRRFPALCVTWLVSGACTSDVVRPPLLVRLTPDPRWQPFVDRLDGAFADLRFDARPMNAHVRREPPHHRHIAHSWLAGRNVCELEIEVPKVFRDPLDGRLYPLGVLELSRDLGTCLTRMADAFVESFAERSEQRPRLGKAVLDPAAREADRMLCTASAAFEILVQLTPANLDAAWRRLCETDFSEEPQFVYRPLRRDPIVLKRSVFEAPVDRVEDPFVAELLREKQEELDRMLSMLRDRGETFLHESEQLFGRPDERLVALAWGIVSVTPVPEELERTVGLDRIVERARAHMLRYREQDPLFPDELELRDDIAATLMVSRGRLLVRADAALSEARLDALLEHEVGTHVLTWFNGSAQPLRLLGIGLAGYEALQEGLAVLAEHLAGALDRSRLRVLAARVLAADAVVRGASFLELFHRLTNEIGLGRRIAFQTAIRALRGGGMTKDLSYLRGLCQVIDHLSQGGRLDALYTGKMSLRHLPIVEMLQERGMIAPPRVLPLVLSDPRAAERLDRIRRSNDTHAVVVAMAEGTRIR